LVDNKIDMRQIPRSNAFMHVRASSVCLQISISLSPPGSIHDPRYITSLPAPLDDQGLGPLTGHPEVIQGLVSVM